MINTKYYKTDLGIVVKDDTIRLKSTYEQKKLVSEEDFNNSNPIQINKRKYLELLNQYFRNTKIEWEYQGEKFMKLDHFGTEEDKYIIGFNVPTRKISNTPCFIVMYHNSLYYTFISGNYYPQMQLMNLKGELLGKWTNIKNLAPVFNKTTKVII